MLLFINAPLLPFIQECILQRGLHFHTIILLSAICTIWIWKHTHKYMPFPIGWLLFLWFPNKIAEITRKPEVLIDESYGIMVSRAEKASFQCFSITAVTGFYHSSQFRMVSWGSGLSGGNWSLSPCNILSSVFAMLWILNISLLFFFLCRFPSFLFSTYLKTQCPPNDSSAVFS